MKSDFDRGCGDRIPMHFFGAKVKKVQKRRLLDDNVIVLCCDLNERRRSDLGFVKMLWHSISDHAIFEVAQKQTKDKVFEYRIKQA